jgi:hypothetical protein
LATLNLGQASQRDHRDVRQAKQARSGETAVARDHIAVVTDEDGIAKSERPDTAGDLGDLGSLVPHHSDYDSLAVLG